MTLIPVGGVFSVIGLSLYYWIDKYNLLRRSSLLSNVPGQLIILTLKMLDVTLVLRVLGELIFDYQIRKGPLVTSWICLGIAVIYQFLPINRLI
jgi:fumarate reductase subunit D